MQTAFLLKS